MVTRRVKTGGAYVGAGGLGAPSPPQWQNTYEDQEFTGAYVADPGGGPDQWQYSGGGSDPGGFSAVLNTSTGVMTITGSGFGTKPTPAPVYFQSFRGVSSGLAATHASVGLDYVETGTNVTIQTITTDGIGGGGALRGRILESGTSETDGLMHIGKYLSDIDEVIYNGWHKLIPSSSPIPALIQWKGARAGKRSVGDPNGPGSNYASSPRMAASILFNTAGTWPSPITSDPGMAWTEHWNSSGAGGSPQNNEIEGSPPPPTTGWSQWWNHEAHYRMNDVGSANAFYSLRLNGALISDQSDEDVRQSSGDHFQYITIAPLITASTPLNRDWDALTSRIYIDSTPARVFLGDSATLTSCTGRFMLPPTAWSGTGITVTHGLDIPSGYTYVYVMDSTGAVVSNGGAGFAYTTV